MLLDAHAHIDQYNDKLDLALEEIRSRRICTVSVAMDVSSYHRTRTIADRCDFIIPSFGIHPWRAPGYTEDLDRLDPWIQEAPMIGEIGLDYHFEKQTEHYPSQRRIFDYLLYSAAQQAKIINLHTKGAEKEVVEKLGEFGVRRSIVHWYSGPLGLIERYLATGAYFTVGVELLFSDHIRSVLAAVPPDRLLTETDNPTGYSWLTGHTGMPSGLDRVVEEIARQKNMTPAEVVSLVSHNFKSLISGSPELAKRWQRLAGEDH